MIGWLKRYWFVPVAAVGAAALWVFRISRETPREVVAFELGLAKAKGDAQRDLVEKGTAVALENVAKRHKGEMHELSKEQNSVYLSLRGMGDASGLAEAALRAGRKARRRRES